MSRVQQVDEVIGRNIRAFRAYQGLSQDALAGKLAAGHPTWTRATVSQVERGVLVSEALSLAEVFGVPFERLIRGVM